MGGAFFRFTGEMKIPDDSLPKIHLIRGYRVVLDSDLAELYGVPTKQLNQAVLRNPDRFPDHYAFLLTRKELTNLKSQIVTSSLHGGRRKPSRVFTKHGALMAGTVLNSPRAVQMSHYLVKAFVQMREALAANLHVLQRLAEIDRKLLEHDVVLREVYEKLVPLLNPPPEPERPKIGFNRGAD
jgi:hypothetical protein